MTRVSSKFLILSATLACFAVFGPPAAAQATLSPAQCNEVMMVGPQHFSATVLAGCAAYFQALADGAAAPNTFQTYRPNANVVVATAGSGG